MKIIFIIALLSVVASGFSQNENQKEITLADSTLLKTGGRIVTLIDNNDFSVFTDYDVFLEKVRSHSNSPAAKKIYDVFMNYNGTGNITADSVANDRALYEKWRMVKGIVISSGQILILNKASGLLEKQILREYGKDMCTTLKIEDKTIIWYCLGQN